MSDPQELSEREKIFLMEYTIAYKLSDRPTPESDILRVKAIDASKNIKIENKLIHRLFEIARSDFSPVPVLRDLANAIPRLNGEKLSAINQQNRIRLTAPNNERTLSDKEKAAWWRWVDEEKKRIANGLEPTQRPFRWELRGDEIVNLDAIEDEELPGYLR